MCFLTSYQRAVDKAAAATGGFGGGRGTQSPAQQRQLSCKYNARKKQKQQELSHIFYHNIVIIL